MVSLTTCVLVPFSLRSPHERPTLLRQVKVKGKADLSLFEGAPVYVRVSQYANVFHSDVIKSRRKRLDCKQSVPDSSGTFPSAGENTSLFSVLWAFQFCRFNRLKRLYNTPSLMFFKLGWHFLCS